MRKIGKSAPAPIEYIAMFLLPRAGLCRYHEWKQLSTYEQHLMIELWKQEQDPIYRREDE